jgi:hypothetical protein
MPIQDQAAVAHVSAVLLRGCINELRFPRICRSRSCRRHHSCGDISDGEPRCLTALHHIDHRALAGLFELVTAILSRRYPPRPSKDAAQRDLEDQAIMVIYASLRALPAYRPWFLDWIDRYNAPEAPPVDTSAVLAEMKATLARDKIMSDFKSLRTS